LIALDASKNQTASSRVHHLNNNNQNTNSFPGIQQAFR
jgi:hypothetical protein